MSVDVVTIGEILAVFLAGDGEPLGHATRFDRQFAGAEANVAVGLARLGLSSRLLGRVGDEPLGHAAMRFLRGEGVDVMGMVLDPDRGTGVLVRDAAGTRPLDVVYARAGSAGSALEPADLPAASIEDARLLHVTGITPVLSGSAYDAVAHALDVARDAGVRISFDPNLRRRLCAPERAAALLRPLAAQAEVVLTGADEAGVLTGGQSRAAAAAWFLDRGVRLVVVKDGPAGAWATDGEREWTAPAWTVPVLDPVGAGDAFDAGFLAAMLSGKEPAACLTDGCAVAACVVRTRGDTPGLPSRAQVRDLVTGSAEVRR